MPHDHADDRYTHGHAPSVVASHAARTVENSAAYLVPHLRPGLSLLDVGCGPGSITVGLADQLAPGHVVGIDRSPEVLPTGPETARDNLTFTTGDVYALDVDDATFDVVHAHQVLHHLTDPVAALREMARVAKPGGLLAVREADYPAMVWWPESAALTRWREVFLAQAQANGVTMAAARRLRGWANAAGLDDITLSTSTWLYADQQSASWWGQSWRERALESSFASRALELDLLDQQGLDVISRGWDEWSRHPDAFFSILHGELLARV